MSEHQTSSAALTQYLEFCVGQQHYCIEILRVREVRMLDAITPLAQSPNYVSGLINLRGEIVPVIDLPIRLARADSATDARPASQPSTDNVSDDASVNASVNTSVNASLEASLEAGINNLTVEAASSKATSIALIAEVRGEVTAFRVDRIMDVLVSDAAQIQPVPKAICRESSDYVVGMLNFDGRMILLLDVERLVPQSEGAGQLSEQRREPAAALE